MTTSFSSIAKLVTLYAATFAAAQSLAQTTVDPAIEHWNRIVAANTIARPDSIPFYLKLNFQIFDLQGKPTEPGTAEVWWSPQHRYQVITSPSWNETSAPGEAHPARTRQGYLIEGLIAQIIQPMLGVGISDHFKLMEADRKFGSTLLRCISINPSIPAPSIPTFCVEPSSDVLRVNSREGAATTRNKMGKFHDTSIPLESTTSYGGVKAISGTVVTLKSIAADDDRFKGLSDRDAPPPIPETSLSGGVKAGRLISSTQPIYPVQAKSRHISGTVVIGAMITREGRIGSAVVIASPDPSLGAAALDAVRTWKYAPYLLNGQPTDVDTIILVNFALSG